MLVYACRIVKLERGHFSKKKLKNFSVALVGLDASFKPFYLCTAVRKFFFFLDPRRTGRIRILDVLAPNLLDELLELRDSETPKAQNWFSAQAALRVYGHYLNLDRDHNGMLSREELQR